MRNRFLTGVTLTALLASGPAPLPIVAAQAAAPGEMAPPPAGDVVVTGSRSDASAGAAESAAMEKGSSADFDRAPGAVMPPRPYPQPQPQSGILTAGEHDDLLNPELYAAYVGRSNLGQQIRDLPRVDTMRVVTVKVNDRNGQPIPFADVVVTCSDGNSITMATQADGSDSFRGSTG